MTDMATFCYGGLPRGRYDILYQNHPKTQIFIKTQLHWAMPRPTLERISQPGRLPLRSFTLEPLGAPGAGAGKSCGNEKLRRINYPKEQRNKTEKIVPIQSIDFPHVDSW